jgi:acyl-CoA hydrolase/RimJ/RimL family protein N-acetyltransferase
MRQSCAAAGTMGRNGYLDKIITAEQAARLVQPGNNVFVGTGCASPRTVLAALEELASPPPDVCIYHFLTTGAYEVGQPTQGTRYLHRVFYVGSDMKPLVPGGRADYVPVRLMSVPRLFENRRIDLDVAFVQVSEPDDTGFVSLGVSVDITMAAVRHARKVIAEVNPHMPRTHGDTFVHLSEIAHVVPVDESLPIFTHAVADGIAHQIGKYIAGVIEDGSTLQIGLGRIPNEALRHLGDRRDLGIHSDVITDGVVDLISAGVITGARKTVHRNRIVASYCVGSERLFRMLDDNPQFCFLPIEQVSDPTLISANHKMVSITQAFAVDLTGQTSIDQFDGEFYGGVSTQPDFIRGASLAPDGKAIICMTSSTDDGETSRIRPSLSHRDGVGISRADVHYIITEYGIAYLFGKSIQERALTLIEIAHPKFRPWLLDEARRLGYVNSQQRFQCSGPYPIEEERSIVLKDGRSILIRPAKASDVRSMQSLFQRLPPEDVYTRFFNRRKALSFEDAQDLCGIDHESEVAFVATGTREHDALVGASCYFANEATSLAEVAFMIDPEWQGVGLGAALQGRMREYAVARGLRGFVADILVTNARMIRLAKTASNDVTIERSGESLQATMLFT